MIELSIYPLLVISLKKFIKKSQKMNKVCRRSISVKFARMTIMIMNIAQ